MQILIVGGHSAQADQVADMKRYVEFFDAAPEATVRFCCLDELLFWVTDDACTVVDTRNDRQLDQYDLVILRGRIRPLARVAYCLSRYLAATGIRFWNDYSAYRPSSKLAQAITMRELGLPQVSTLVCENSQQLLARAEQYVQFPLIAKDNFGTHGAKNFLVRNRAELENIVQEHVDTVFLLQPYVPNTCDYRILVAGSEQLIIKREAAAGSHLNNTSQGGRATLVPAADFPTETLRQAHRFAQALHMDVAGVDVMPNSQTGEMVFLEINSQPQLLTGAFLTEKAELLARFVATAADKP